MFPLFTKSAVANVLWLTKCPETDKLLVPLTLSIFTQTNMDTLNSEVITNQSKVCYRKPLLQVPII